MNTQPDPSHSIPHCPQCGGAIEGDAPEGLCPRCLLRLARDLSDLELADQELESPLVLGHFADYELLSEIGHGGMGVVYRARQKSLDRIVALKMLLGGQFAEPQARARFRSEAEITAQLQHPNIVAIHEVGEHDHLPFFTMDFVEGRNLAEVARDKPLTPVAAAGYLSIIARAIAYAHEHGVLHRDLKPSNILIDGSDQPRITDFGLAKRLTGSTTSPTLSGEALGSPNFMPPEQAAGRHKEIGPPSDVYGLGAILYYLVTSQPPFIADNLTAAVRQVQDQEPVSPRMLNPGVPKDIETICLKCLQKEPSKRYATAGELADELDRFRRGEPIQARPVGPAGRVWRWCRRRPALATLAAAVALLAVVSTTVAVRMAIERDGRERERYRANIQLAAARIEEGSIDVALETLLDCPERFRHWEWGYLVAQCHREVLTLEEAKTNIISDNNIPEWRCGFSADGRRVGAVHPGGIVQVWEWPSGRPLWGLREELDPWVGVVWLSDWSGVALARWDLVEVVRMGQPDSRLVLQGHSSQVHGLAFSADGQRLAAAAMDDTVRIWDTMDGHELAVFPIITGWQRLFFNGDGGRLIVAGSMGAVVYDSRTGQTLTRLDAGADPIATVFPDLEGERFVTRSVFASGVKPGHFSLWTTKGLVKHLTSVGVHPKGPVFSPDRSAFFLPGENSVAAVRSSETGEVLFNIPARVRSAAFSPDGHRLATRGGSSVIHIWEPPSLTSPETIQLKGHTEGVNDMAFSPDGRLLASVSANGTVKVWSALPGREFLEQPSASWGLSLTSDGRKVATAPRLDGTTIWDTQSGRQLAQLSRLHRMNRCVAFSPDDQQLAVGDVFGDIEIWEVETGRLVRVLQGHEFMVFGGLSYSGDGRLLASAARDGTVRIWAAYSGEALHVLQHDHPDIQGIDFSPDSQWLASTDGKLARIWNTETGSCERLLQGHLDSINAVRFSPDGSKLATTSGDGTLRLWDVRTGETLLTWKLRGKFARGLAFSPDGRRIALRVCKAQGWAADAPSLEIWDVQTQRLLLAYRGFIELGQYAQFSPDGRRVVTDWWYNKLRQWEAFPWTDRDYPGSSGQPLRQRMKLYATRYWQDRLQAESQTGNDYPPLYVNLPVDRSRIPARDPATPAHLVNLSDFYTGSLQRASCLIYGDGSLMQIDLRNAPTGLVSFHGIPFDMRGIIQLGCLREDGCMIHFPSAAERIRVQQSCVRMHAILGSVSRGSEGEVIGKFVLHYTDDAQHELQIVYGSHVRDRWIGGDSRNDTDLARIAWEGPHAYWGYTDKGMRIYHVVWDNPRPDQEIVSLDFVSKMTTTAAPFLIAVTLE